jgi:hypothetical protein
MASGAAIGNRRSLHAREKRPVFRGLGPATQFGLTSNNLVAILPIEATILLLSRYNRFKPFIIRR